MNPSHALVCGMTDASPHPRRRTWKKLSNNAKAAARTIPMDPGLQSIVAEAIQEVEDKEAAAAASADNSARDQL